MQPLALYPKTSRLVMGIALGLFCALIGASFLPLVGDDLTTGLFAYGIIGMGLAIVGLIVWRWVTRRPSFEADADGFCIMGRAKLPWTVYRGIRIQTTFLGPIPVAAFVRIKLAGTNPFRRNYIHATYFSDRPKAMAATIEAYATMAQQALASSTVQTAQPATQTAALGPKARQAFPELSPSQGSDSPIQTAPTFAERLMGRKSKVI